MTHRNFEVLPWLTSFPKLCKWQIKIFTVLAEEKIYFFSRRIRNRNLHAPFWDNIIKQKAKIMRVSEVHLLVVLS